MQRRCSFDPCKYYNQDSAWGWWIAASAGVTKYANSPLKKSSGVFVIIKYVILGPRDQLRWRHKFIDVGIDAFKCCCYVRLLNAKCALAATGSFVPDNLKVLQALVPECILRMASNYDSDYLEWLGGTEKPAVAVTITADSRGG